MERARANDWRLALFCKAGSGKTLTALAIMGASRIIPWYVCVRRSHFPTWVEQMARWWEDAPVQLCSIDKLPVGELGKGKPYGVVVDESYYVKGANSARHQAVRKWCDGAAGVLLLNANPVVTSVLDLWAQMRLVIGREFMSLVRVYSTYFVTDLQGYGFHELPGASERLCAHPHLQRYAVFHHPPSNKKVKHVKVLVGMLPRQRLLSRSISENLCATIEGTTVEYTHVMEKAIRLHQIAGGHLPIGDTLWAIPSRKFQWLKRWCAENPKERAVVWCAYRHEVERIAREFGASYVMGGKSGGPSGSQLIAATTDMGQSTNRFGQIPNAIYFSQNWKWYLRSQSRYRIDRMDSAHKSVRYYYLLTRGSVDEFIHARLAERGMTAARLFNPALLQKFFVDNPLDNC